MQQVLIYTYVNIYINILRVYTHVCISRKMYIDSSPYGF